MFRNIPDAEAEATVDAAWQQGTRYFDTAPFYGAGLSEIRLGKALTKRKRDEYRLSTKVGRIILDEIDSQARNFGEKGDLFKFGRPKKIVYDYTEKGAVKSIEDSLKRMGVDRLDFVWIHDVARDFHGDEWLLSSKPRERELSAPWRSCENKALLKLGDWARTVSSLVSWRLTLRRHVPMLSYWGAATACWIMNKRCSV